MNYNKNIDFYIPTGDDYSHATVNKELLENKKISYKKIEIEAIDLVDTTNSKFDVIKIDVEGYELDVILGMRNLLSNKSLKAIGIEIHFAILEENGNGNAVKTIIRNLKNSNFKVKWLDPSHIIAIR